MSAKAPTRSGVAEARAVAYQKPPILEAIVEFRLAEPIKPRVLERVSKRLGKLYETLSRQKEVQFELNPETAESEVKSSSPIYRHASSDQVDIFIGKPASLAWSRLAPYEGWAPFISRVEREYRIVVEVLGVRKVERIGVRYINRIDVPSDDAAQICRYEDYLAININLPESFDPVTAYKWRIDRTFVEIGLDAMIHSATMLPEIPGTGAFLLDIDVSITTAIPVKIDEIFTRLADMRRLKNMIFEEAITDRARESFR